MGKFILTDARLFAGGADLSGASNKIEISAEVEEKDVTNYRSGGWKEVLGGIKSGGIMGEGFWEAGDPGMVDDASWAQFGGVGPWTASPIDTTVGALAWVTKMLRADYMFGGVVGDVAPWKSKGSTTWPIVRGQVEHAAGTAETADDASAGAQLGAAAAGQRLYSSLHVLSVAGTATPTLTVDIESDADNTFASPTTQLSFDPATAQGGQILRTAGGAITDTWYRASWTITGTTPSFLFLLAFGIR